MSSSSAVVDIEILFELLYQALERTRDRLNRRKRREAESPSLLEEEDLAFFKDAETEQSGLSEDSNKREAQTPSLLEEENLAFFKDDETEQPGLLEEKGSPFNDEKKTWDSKN